MPSARTLPRPGAEQLRRQLAAARVVPVIRTDSADRALDLAARCVACGLEVIEFTATTPGWETALAEARRRFSTCVIGCGTVRTRLVAARARDVGADFLVSPHPAPEVRAEVGGEIPFIEGGMTVGEVLSASAQGIAKLFPADIGGPGYLRTLLTLDPTAQIVPTGGIPLRDVPRWLEAGALAVGVGRDLFEHPDLAAVLRDLVVAAERDGVRRGSPAPDLRATTGRAAGGSR